MDTKELHALIAKKKALKDAAPDMLEALKLIVDSEKDSTKWYIAKKAIAKAEGRGRATLSIGLTWNQRNFRKVTE